MIIIQPTWFMSCMFKNISLTDSSNCNMNIGKVQATHLLWKWKKIILIDLTPPMEQRRLSYRHKPCPFYLGLCAHRSTSVIEAYNNVWTFLAQKDQIIKYVLDSTQFGATFFLIDLKPISSLAGRNQTDKIRKMKISSRVWVVPKSIWRQSGVTVLKKGLKKDKC